MTWRYQMTHETGNGGDIYAIREVYLEGNQVVGWTADPIPATGDSSAEVVEALTRMLNDAERFEPLEIEDEA